MVGGTPDSIILDVDPLPVDNSESEVSRWTIDTVLKGVLLVFEMDRVKYFNATSTEVGTELHTVQYVRIG